MHIRLPLAAEDCTGLAATDFDTYKIPAPPQGFEAKGDSLLLLFNETEEALKYAIHLNDVHERMERSADYDCSRKKIQEIISAVNDQADFKSIKFD